MKPIERIPKEDELERELRKHMLGLGFEERVMEDEAYFASVEAIADVVEDELVEEYVSGELNDEERNGFERRLKPLPEVQEKLLLAEALTASSARAAKPPGLLEQIGRWFRPVLQPAYAMASVAFLLAVSGGAFSVFHISNLQNRLSEADTTLASLRDGQREFQAQLAAERERGSRVTAELDEARSRLSAVQQSSTAAQRAVLAFRTFVLKPGIVRSNSGAVIVPVVGGRGLVEFRLEIGIDDWEEYTASLIDSSARVVLRQQGLEAVTAGDSAFAILQVPEQVLSRDSYRIQLEGKTSGGRSESIDTFQFSAAPR